LVRSCFTVEVEPPFRLDLTVWALRRRPINQVDRWDGTTYRRTVLASNAPVAVAVTQIGGMDKPRLCVDVVGAQCGASHSHIRELLARTFGLGIDLSPFYRIAGQDDRLNDLATRFRGMRPPRFPTIFEALMNGIACQQLSLEVGLTLLNRLVACYGQGPSCPTDAGKAFPRPHDLAGAMLESLRQLGFSRGKSTAILANAAAAERQDVDLERLGDRDDASLCATLDELHGVGRWTAEYVLLRGYGRLGVFPGDDVGARNGLQRWLGLTRPLDYEHTKKMLRRWQPYGGLVYLHLLLKHLDEKGILYRAAEASVRGGASQSGQRGR
jgi:DNA-3-methyladenine glycosylase II